MLHFNLLYLVSQLLAIAIVILTTIWVVTFMGVVWDVTDVNIYNWHSICMVLGMVFFQGNSILIFRAFKNTSKKLVKIFHVVLHAAAIIFTGLGLAVEFISNLYHNEPVLYSLHAWVGITTVVIFISQFIFGSIIFLIPLLNQQLKILYLPVHVFFGIVCFVMAISTCLIGLNENARFNTNYSRFPPEGILINIIGALLVIYGFLVVYLLTKSSFKKPSVSNHFNGTAW